MDEWRVIPEYPGYSINKCGDVLNNKTHRQLKHNKFSNGYSHVTLCDDTGHHIHGVHRLVAKAFISNPNGYDYVNHLDGNKSNNHVENLEWCTQSENMKHAYKIGLQKPIASQIEYSLSRAREKNKRPVQNIETGVCYPSIVECAKAEGIGHSAVSFHLAGKAKKCRFKYADEGGNYNGE